VFSEFWQTKVDPLLLEHPELRPAVRDQHFQIPRGVVTDDLGRHLLALPLGWFPVLTVRPPTGRISHDACGG
jgi:hypothetical protein